MYEDIVDKISYDVNAFLGYSRIGQFSHNLDFSNRRCFIVEATQLLIADN